MSKFDELLNNPLPSRFYESDDMDMDLDKEFSNLSKEFDESDDEGDDTLGLIDDIIGSNSDVYPDDTMPGVVEGCKSEGCKSEGCQSEGCKSEGCKSEGCQSEGCKSEGCKSEGCKSEGCRSEEGEDDDDMDDDLSDLEAELNVNGNITSDDDDDEDDDDDDQPYDPEEEAEPLDSENDKRADQLLAVTATPVLLEDCNIEDIVKFTESGETEIAITEGLILESDINQILYELSDSDVYTEGAFASPNQKYKMTKKARFNQLYELSLQIEARAHHDPLYPKMQKAYKIERTIKKVWRKKYGNLAAKRAKRYLKRLMQSGSPTLKKAASNVIGK